jgi:hypothetical protein
MKVKANCFGWLLFGFLLFGRPGEPPGEQALPESSRAENQVEEWRTLYDSLGLAAKGLSLKAFELAWAGFSELKYTRPYMAIADFTQSSVKKRLYVLDMVKKELVVQTFVAHGRNSGEEYASRFSNREGSFQSSLGFYRTSGTYQGKHGLSLRLEGVEPGINDQAARRAIVMHSAEYVSEKFIRVTGRLGRSQGCPAIPVEEHLRLIGLLKEGSGLFIYADSDKYLADSPLLSKLRSSV